MPILTALAVGFIVTFFAALGLAIVAMLLYRATVGRHRPVVDESHHPWLALIIWTLALTVGAVAGWMTYRSERSRGRIDSGLCARCGYDLRATPDRCPECGTVRVS